MALFKIDLGLDNNKIEMINYIYKYFSIFIVMHILINMSGMKSYGFIGNLFNENFIMFMIILAISIMFYYLVFLEIIQFT